MTVVDGDAPVGLLALLFYGCLLTLFVYMQMHEPLEWRPEPSPKRSCPPSK